MLIHDTMDQQAQSSIVDELREDLVSICCALVYVVKHCQVKLNCGTIKAPVPCYAPNLINNAVSHLPQGLGLMSQTHHVPLPTSSIDENYLWTELMCKALSAVELLCTMKGSSASCMREMLLTSGASFIRCDQVSV